MVKDSDRKQPAGKNGGEEKAKTSLAYKYIIGFVVAIGIFIFLIAGLLLVAKIIPDTFALVASVFSGNKKDNATPDATTTGLFGNLTADDKTISSGETVKFFWQGPNSDTYAYSLTYFCADNVKINFTDKEIPCDKPFFFENKNNSLDVAIISDKTRFSDALILVEAEQKSNSELSKIGEVLISVTNTSVSSPTGGTILGTETVATSSISNTNSGQTPPKPVSLRGPDLMTRIIAVGIINSFGTFIPTNQFSSSDTVAIQFQVANVGDSYSGLWSFRASLPVKNISDQQFNSAIQSSLAPGASIIFTLSFGGLQDRLTNVVVITTDPSNLVRETSEINNIASVTLTLPGGSTSTNVGTTSSDRPDLEIELDAIGTLSSSGNFRETNNIDTNDELAIRFIVRNRGGESSGSWDFDVDVNAPGSSHDREYDFTSRTYNSLTPGQSREVIISFDDLIDDGRYDFRIVVDPDRDTSDNRRSNNTIEFDVDID